MANLERSKQRRGLVAVDGAMALIVILLIFQIWLLSATLETFLAGHTGAVLPSAIFSGLVFLGCVALDLFVMRVDRESRKP
jgi:F0F1-type ATP synthase assembly protein I